MLDKPLPVPQMKAADREFLLYGQVNSRNFTGRMYLYQYYRNHLKG